MEKTFQKLGEALRKRRKELGLTQAEVAKGADVHVQFVSNWERGLCYPPEANHKKLAKILKLGPTKRGDFYDAPERVAIWEALSDDYDRIVMKKFKELV